MVYYLVFLKFIYTLKTFNVFVYTINNLKIIVRDVNKSIFTIKKKMFIKRNTRYYKINTFKIVRGTKKLIVLQ